MAKRLDNRALREFRTQAARLKKAGVIPATNAQGRKVDISQAHPSTIVGGKTLREYIRKFPQAAEGKAAVVTLPRSKSIEYGKLGYRRLGNMVEVPALPGTKVTVTAAGEIQTKDASGITIVHLPIQYHNLEQYLKDIRKDARKINKMKADNELFGFSFYGSHNNVGHPDIQHVLDTIKKYDSIRGALNDRNPREAADIVQNLIIIKAPKAEMYKWGGEGKREKYLRGIKVTRSQKRANWPEYRKEQYKASRRAQEKKRYDKKKGKS
jgi:hypothetical protein